MDRPSLVVIVFVLVAAFVAGIAGGYAVGVARTDAACRALQQHPPTEYDFRIQPP